MGELGRGAGVLSAIGNTPLIELNRIVDGARFRLYGKFEALNPGGSTKDRPALEMMLDKIHGGELRPGRSVVVESSSGNLGIGLAQICRYFAIRFVCVIDPKTNQQTIGVLRAFGAEIDMVTDVDAVTSEYLPVRLRRVHELLATTPNAYWPDQYSNPLNARAHHTTMREIVDAVPGGPDFLFCATSSCGTLRGCSEYVRENRLPVRIVAVDAMGSCIFGQPSAPRLIPGHGAAVRPRLFGADLADEVIHVHDLDCLVACRQLVAREAVLAGGSSGAVISAVVKMRDRIPAGSRCVVILPDRGERYLDTIYNDEWVRDKFGDVAHLWAEPAAETTPC